MKTQYKIMLGMIFLMAILPMVSAQADLGTFKKNDCVNLIQICGNCSYVNISSITSPNSSILISDVEMTKRGTEYNYSFCDTKILGTYIVNGFGDDNGETGVWAYTFEVTTTGTANTITMPVLLFLIGLVLLVLGFIFKNEFFGLFSGMLITATGVYIMIYGLGFIADMYTRAVAGVTLGIGLIVVFAAMFEIMKGDSTGELHE